MKRAALLLLLPIPGLGCQSTQRIEAPAPPPKQSLRSSPSGSTAGSAPTSTRSAADRADRPTLDAPPRHLGATPSASSSAPPPLDDQPPPKQTTPPPHEAHTAKPSRHAGPICRSVRGRRKWDRVAGDQRSCETDADCVQVPLDCVHKRCTGINKKHASDYGGLVMCPDHAAGPGYNKDCLQYQAPKCRAGCCVSVPTRRR